MSEKLLMAVPWTHPLAEEAAFVIDPRIPDDEVLIIDPDAMQYDEPEPFTGNLGSGASRDGIPRCLYCEPELVRQGDPICLCEEHKERYLGKP